MDLQQKQEKAREAFSKRNENIFANANINEPITPSDKLDDIVLNSSENIETHIADFIYARLFEYPDFITSQSEKYLNPGIAEDNLR